MLEAPPFPIRGDLTARDRRRFRLGIEHLYDLCPRAVGEFIWEFGLRGRRTRTLLAELDCWRAVVSPLLMEVSGGPELPPPVHLVTIREDVA